jgi:TIR domain
MTGIKIFFSYAREDEELRDELAKHLMVLVRYNGVELWHDRKIQAGDGWANKINAQIQQAQIILLLVSPDFFASSYCCENEMAVALARHNKGEAVVIPVILRPCDWDITELKKLQAVPKDAKPVCLWDNSDEAFADIVRKIREYAINLATVPLLDPDSPPKTSVLKNSIPNLESHIPQKISSQKVAPVTNYNIVFVDIRGFTKWLTNQNSTINAAEKLISVLYMDLEKVFGRFTPLGESALIVFPANAKNRPDLELELKVILDKIYLLDDIFEKHKEELNISYSCNCDELKLSFGVARDSQILVFPNRTDFPSYIGIRIALAKRLGSIALPSGIVKWTPAGGQKVAEFKLVT